MRKFITGIPKLFRRYVKATWSAVFNLDYEMTQSIMPVYGFSCALTYVLFYFHERSLGFHDWMPIRSLCIAASLAVLFWPRSRRFRIARRTFWEASVALSLPITQSFLFLINPDVEYWNTSNVFWAIFLGISTKPVWMPIQLVLGQFLGYRLALAVWEPIDAAKVQALLDQQFTIWITACLGSALKIALEIFHRRGMDLAGANARAEEAESRESEIKAANAELRRREEVIKRFVRPSLFEELQAGRNPVEFKPVKREMTVMFCDIRNFTRLTEVLSAEEKQTFLNRYFSLITGPILAHGGEVDKIMGDCVMGLFPDGGTAVRAAVDMRLHLQEFNREMYAQGIPKIRNGIGIAKGEVLLGNFGSFEKLDRTVIGEAVNIASRLEAKTKMYDLEVVVTEDVIRDLEADYPHCRWIDLVQVKGSSRQLKLYEIYGHQPEEVRAYKSRTRTLFEKALTIYFRKGFRDAARLFNAMLAEVPAHRHASADLMDNILNYYIAHCEAWNSDVTGIWQRIERWDGVHVFYEK